MLIGHPRQKVYLAVGATDLRKAVDGLAVIVQLGFELSPFEPHWPQEGEEFNPLDITWQDLRWLLESTALKPIDKRRINPPKYAL